MKKNKEVELKNCHNTVTLIRLQKQLISRTPPEWMFYCEMFFRHHGSPLNRSL